jgi:hypothetical protein
MMKEDMIVGFFAGELERILSKRQKNSPWSLLSRMGIHPQQVDRLKKAYDDIGQVATLQKAHLDQIRFDLELSQEEWARLNSASRADTVLRLFLYHDYPLDQAARMANAIYVDTLQNLLLVGDKMEDIFYPDESAIEAGAGRRRARKSAKPREED